MGGCRAPVFLLAGLMLAAVCATGESSEAARLVRHGRRGFPTGGAGGRSCSGRGLAVRLDETRVTVKAFGVASQPVSVLIADGREVRR